MSLGVAPGSSNGGLRLPATARGGAGAGGGGNGPTQLPLRREWGWASRSSSSSSSFRTRAAAVGEGGSVAAKARSFYELLGISEEGSYDEIKRAYKQMARKYHPDVSPPDCMEEYTRRFIEVQEAYETLSDPRRREHYDRQLAGGLHLAFSARRRFEEELDERSSWRNRWEDQIAELKRRSMNKDSEGNLSWGAQMRRRRAESSN